MDAEAQLERALARYTSEVADTARAVLTKMRARLPGAVRLVYDNFNALVIGFGPNERPSDAVFSVAVYPRWVSLFFFHGAELPDPSRVLKGSGRRIRHVVLGSAGDLDKPEVRALMRAALAAADPPVPSRGEGRLVVRSISATQRPRRPRATALASRRRS
jgi:hypothetical protein